MMIKLNLFLSIFRNLCFHFIFVCISTSFFGQLSTLQTKVTLPNNSYTVKELTETIYHQTDISISYSNSKIKDNTKVVINKHTTDLGSILYTLKSKNNITAKVQGKHVLLLPMLNSEPGKSQLKESKRLRAQAAQKTKKNNINKIPEKIDEIKSPNQNAIVSIQESPLSEIEDVEKMEYLNTVTVLSEEEEKYFFRIKQNEQLSKVSNNLLNEGSFKVDAQKWKNLIDINASINVDENFYFNPGLELGHRYFYGTLNYSMHSEYSHIRYGASLQFPITQNWQIGAFMNFGNFEEDRDYYYDLTPPPGPDFDSLGITPDPVIYEGRYGLSHSLFKVGIKVDYFFNNQLGIYASVVFNNLNSEFNQEKEKRSLIQIFPVDEISISQNEFNILKIKPINLRNSFSLYSTSFSQDWVGFQIGIVYRLNR